jgi:hypothetical protein
MDEVELFIANFQVLGPLGFQGWVVNVIPQNVKKILNPCTLLVIFGLKDRSFLQILQNTGRGSGKRRGL